MTLYTGLRGYWGFDEAVGVTSIDRRGFRNATVPADAWSLTGKVGAGSLSPASLSEFAVVPGIGRDFAANLPVLSVQSWVHLGMAPSAMWGPAHIIATTEDAGSGSGFSLGFLSGTTTLSFRVYDHTGTPHTATYTEAATSGWFHYVGVLSGAAVTIYRNGAQVATTAADGTVRRNAAIDLAIGHGFQGLIDEVAIWDRSLSAAEVTALYNSGSGLSIAYVPSPPPIKPVRIGSPDPNVEGYKSPGVVRPRQLDFSQ